MGIYLLLIPANLVLTCGPTPDPAAYFRSTEKGVKTGGVRMIRVETPKGPYRVWTKRIGHHPSIKLLLLHGGPCLSHEYFECMESYLPEAGIEFVYYDQLGSAYSDQPRDSSIWEVDRFVEEGNRQRKNPIDVLSMSLSGDSICALSAKGLFSKRFLTGTEFSWTSPKKK